MITKEQIKQMEKANVNNFSEELKEEIKDLFEVTSYFLSQLEVEDNGILFSTKNRGEA